MMASTSNIHLVDPYSICHVAAGVAARGIGLNLSTTLILHTLFEFVENMYLKKSLSRIFPDSTTDTPLNIIGDTLSAALGWYINDVSSAGKVNLKVSNLLPGGK